MNSREKKQPQIPVTHCSWCGSYDLGIGWQQNEAIVTFRRNALPGQPAEVCDLPELRSGLVSVCGQSRGGFHRWNRGL